MKPNGLTWDLKVIKPTQTEDAIWEAVRLAIIEQWTPKQLKCEIAEAWEYELKEEIKSAKKELYK